MPDPLPRNNDLPARLSECGAAGTDGRNVDVVAQQGDGSSSLTT